VNNTSLDSVRSSRETSHLDVLFVLAVLYLLTYYVQPGGRVAILGKIRFELLLGGALVMALFLMRIKRIIADEAVNRAMAFFFGAMCLSFIGAIQSHTVTEAVPVFIRIVKGVCTYFMIIGTVDSENRIEKYTWAYVFAMLVIVGEPFLLSLRGQNLYAREDGVIRLYGVGQYESPNGLGTLAVMNLVFLYYLFFHYRSLLVRIFLGGFALVSLRVIMLTASRSAYVALIVLIACLWTFSKYRLRFLVIVVVAALIAIPLVPEMYKARFASLKQIAEVITARERVESSVGGRWFLFKTGFRVWLDYPIFGCGLDSFRHAAQKYGTWMQTHNLLTQVLSNMGVVGLAAFSFLIYTFVRVLRDTRRKLIEFGQTDGFLYCLNTTLFVFLFARLITGLLAQHILYTHSWWVIGGLTAVSARVVADMSEAAEQPQQEKRVSKVKRRPVRIVWDA